MSVSARSRRPGGAARVECERLSAELRVAGARTCVCLGKLDTPDLLALCLEASPRPVRLVDPGFCESCPEGGSAELPGADVRAETNALLAEMGLASLAPIVERVDSRRNHRDDSEALRRARRAFFQRLVRASGAGTAPSTQSHAAGRRAATLAALKRLSKKFDTPLPPGFFPALIVSAACRDHGVCAALCPTRALKGYEGAGTRGIVFDAALCTACGACESGCPERAIRLQRDGDGRVPAGDVRLTAYELRICERCEDEFAAADGQALCPTCRKDAALFADPFMVANIGGRRVGDSRSQEV